MLAQRTSHAYTRPGFAMNLCVSYECSIFHLSYFLFQSTNRFFQNFVRLFLRKLDGFCIFVGLRFFTLNSPDQILVGTPEKTVFDVCNG